MKEEIENILCIFQKLQTVKTEFPIQYVICLSHIALDEGLGTTDLANKTGMALSTVSRITNALAKNDGSYELIEIKIATHEKRRKQLFLTNKGKDLLKKITKS